MSEEKTGIVVLGDNHPRNVAVIYEISEKDLYEFSPETVAGNIDEYDDQGRKFPARLNGSVVTFSTGENNEVTSVTFTGQRSFIQTLCDPCSGLVTMAAKYCTCGYTTNSVYLQCDVCAIKKGECAKCGTPIIIT